jgi:hypothetical protein
MMISKEESPRTKYDPSIDTFFMHYKNIQISPLKDEFTSDKCVVSKQDLDILLTKFNYFKP